MVARVKTWTTNATLASSDLNAEFNNVINAISTGTADHIDLTDVYAWTGAHSWSGATTHTNTLTVGVDDTGHDVKFFGATSGQYMLWDESADELVLAGDTKLSFHDAAGGENIIATSNGHLEVNAGTTLDITAPTVDLNSSTEFNIDTAAYDLNASGAVTIDGAGVSIDSSSASNLTTSSGALTITSAAAATWSTAAGALTLGSGAAINITPAAGSAIVLDGTINVDAGVVTGATSITSTAFVGDITGDVTGNADTFTATANNSANETVYPVFVDGATGAQGAETDTGLTYNPSTGLLSSAGVTASGTVTYGSLSDGSITITAFVDEDDMSSNSATLVPTQQSVKAYVDSQGGSNASTVTITDNENTNETNAIIFTAGGDVDGGNLGLESDGDLTYNPSSGLLSATAVTATGVVTAGGFTIGSAVIAEAELETIDGVTAGTVAASKAVVVDSNKDAASFRNITLTGELDAGSLDVSGNADIDGTTNLDAVDIDGAVQADGTITVGVDDTGYDVKLFGATSGKYVLWDQSGDTLLFPDSPPITLGTGADATLQFNATNTVLATAGSLILQTNGTTEAMRIGSAGAVYINETANTDMTIGLTINQAANDDEIIALKSSDVAHPATAVAEAATYGAFKKANAGGGGLHIMGFSDTGLSTNNRTLLITGTGGNSTGDTSDTVYSAGVVTLDARKTDGSTGVGLLGDTDCAFVFTNYDHCRMLLKGNGVLHLTNTTLVALDDEDDNQLVRAMQRASSSGGVRDSKYDNPFYSYDKLLELGLAGEADEHGTFLFPVQKRLHAHEGAMWQTHCRVMDMGEKVETLQLQLDEANAKLARLEMN